MEGLIVVSYLAIVMVCVLFYRLRHLQSILLKFLAYSKRGHQLMTILS